MAPPPYVNVHANFEKHLKPMNSNSRRQFIKESVAATVFISNATFISGLVRADGEEDTGTTTGITTTEILAWKSEGYPKEDTFGSGYSESAHFPISGTPFLQKLNIG